MNNQGHLFGKAKRNPTSNQTIIGTNTKTFPIIVSIANNSTRWDGKLAKNLDLGLKFINQLGA